MTTKLKVRVVPKFIAALLSGIGTNVRSAGSSFYVDLDVSLFSLASNASDANNTYALTYDTATGVYQLILLKGIGQSFSYATLTAGTTYTALPTDDVILVKTGPMAITVDWSKRRNKLTVVDQTGNAATSNITITPVSGQTQLAQTNYVYVIDGNGGNVTLTPLPDGSGAY